jgi:ABC-type spermidine/putrescine transport system permease subunit II
MRIYAMARTGVSPEVNALSVLITIALGVVILLAAQLEHVSAATARPGK